MSTVELGDPVDSCARNVRPGVTLHQFAEEPGGPPEFQREEGAGPTDSHLSGRNISI